MSRYREKCMDGFLVKVLSNFATVGGVSGKESLQSYTRDDDPSSYFQTRSVSVKSISKNISAETLRIVANTSIRPDRRVILIRPLNRNCGTLISRFVLCETTVPVRGKKKPHIDRSADRYLNVYIYSRKYPGRDWTRSFCENCEYFCPKKLNSTLWLRNLVSHTFFQKKKNIWLAKIVINRLNSNVRKSTLLTRTEDDRKLFKQTRFVYSTLLRPTYTRILYFQFNGKHLRDTGCDWHRICIHLRTLKNPCNINYFFFLHAQKYLIKKKL